jgi:hypothetical protein
MKADPARLDRARKLKVERIGNRQFRVGKHYVDLNEADPCHCADKIWRLKDHEKCKHILAALLHEGEA